MTWLAGNALCTLIIPKPIAQEYGLDKPSNVVIQGRPEGILITKLELENSQLHTKYHDCRIDVNAVRGRVNVKEELKDKIE